MFLRHVRWLQRRFDLVSLDEAQRRLRGGSRTACVSITFDDGYASNCDYALPLLLAEGIPCTYFVTSQNVLEGIPFAHDVARGRPLAPNTIDQLRDLADRGIEIGCHTRTHASLARCNQAELHAELVTARDELESALDRPLRHFAFPFGQYVDLSPEAFAAAQQAGYESACSAYGGYNFPGDDPFHLQRIPADLEMSRMRNWLTVDRRKIATLRYEYKTAADAASLAGAAQP